MSIHVQTTDQDWASYESADRFLREGDGTLVIMSGDGEVAAHAPGRWNAVRKEQAEVKLTVEVQTLDPARVAEAVRTAIRSVQRRR